MTTTEAEQEVQRRAAALYESNPDWATFFRKVLGVRGIVRRLYRSREALAAFKTTEAYDDIQRMLRELRAKKDVKVDPEEEPISVITVRIPKSLHDTLREEAYDHRTSMNRLCIAKLLQLIEAAEADGDGQPEDGDGKLEDGGGVDL